MLCGTDSFVLVHNIRIKTILCGLYCTLCTYSTLSPDWCPYWTGQHSDPLYLIGHHSSPLSLSCSVFTWATFLLRKRTLSRRKRTFLLLDKHDIVKRTYVFNSNTFIVYDILIPYGTENKLFIYYFIYLPLLSLIGHGFSLLSLDWLPFAVSDWSLLYI